MGTGYGYHEGASDVAIICYIDFEPNNGDAIPQETVLSKDFITAPAGVVRTGYSLGGWYTDAACTAGNKWDFATMHPAGDMTLYAQWLPGVTFDGNSPAGGPTGMPSPNPRYVEPGSAATRPGDPALAGYTFAGWYEEAGCVNAYDFATPVTEPMTLYAKWLLNVKVSYDGNSSTGGQVPTDSRTYHPGETVTVLANTGDLEKVGYVFLGWDTDQTASTPTYPVGSLPAANAHTLGTDSTETFYAVWKRLEFHVTYHSDGADAGYDTPPTDGNTYYWENNVTILGDNGMKKTGATFAGWENRLTGERYQGGGSLQKIKSDVELYPVWDDNTYAVIYQDTGADNGGAAPLDGGTYKAWDAVTVKGNEGTPALSRTGYTFDGWQPLNPYADTAAHYGPGRTEQLTIDPTLGDVTFIPVWTAKEVRLTYADSPEFPAEGGQLPVDAGGRRYDQTVTLLGNVGGGGSANDGTAPLKKAGKVLTGWADAPMTALGTVPSTANRYSLGQAMVLTGAQADSGEVKLYPIWEEAHYTVTYDGNGSTGGELPTDPHNPYSYHVAVTVLPHGTLERSNAVFREWNTRPDGTGTGYNDGGSATFHITEDTILYAIWDTESFKVTYHYDTADATVTGQLPVDGNVYFAGDTVTVLGNVGGGGGANDSSDPLVKGRGIYAFAGWNTKPDGSGTTYPEGGTFLINADAHLYATWSNLLYVDISVNTEPKMFDASIYEYSGVVPTAIDEFTLRVHFQAGGISYSVDTDNQWTAAAMENATYVTIPLGEPGTTTDLYLYAESALGETLKYVYHITRLDGQQLYVDLAAAVGPALFDPAVTAYTASVEAAQESVALSLPSDGGCAVSYAVGDPAAQAAAIAQGETVQVPLGEEGTVTMLYVHAVKPDGGETVYEYAVTREKSPEPTVITTGGGGGGSAYYYSVVYLPGSGGAITDGAATEQVRRGRYPTKTPVITPLPGYQFLGWSLDGESVTDPLKKTVTENLVYTALYDRQEADHVWYMQGYEDGAFRPDAPLLRSEITAMLARLDAGYVPGEKEPSFPDVTRDAWYWPYVGFAQSAGLVRGYPDGTFRPNGEITRAEFVTIMCNYLGLSNTGSSAFPDAQGHWAEGCIAQLTAAGVLDGYPDGTFRPDATIARAEAAKVVNRVYRRGPSHELTRGESLPYGDVAPSYWAYDDIVEASLAHPVSRFHQ